MILKKLQKIFLPQQSATRQWQENEYFDPDWKARIKQMAQWINVNETVVDLGCGQSWLTEFLPGKNQYIGVDYARRNAATVVCNFNTDPFPVIPGDCAFVSGCLEYIEQPDAFIAAIAGQYKKCIISYCTLEAFPNRKQRDNLAWKNHLTKAELLACFARHGFIVESETSTSTQNSLFCLRAGITGQSPGIKDTLLSGLEQRSAISTELEPAVTEPG